MRTYTIYIMRVSGLNDKRDDFERLGLLNESQHRRQCIERIQYSSSIWKGLPCLYEHAYQIPRRGKGGFKADNCRTSQANIFEI